MKQTKLFVEFQENKFHFYDVIEIEINFNCMIKSTIDQIIGTSNNVGSNEKYKKT